MKQNPGTDEGKYPLLAMRNDDGYFLGNCALVTRIWLELCGS